MHTTIDSLVHESGLRNYSIEVKLAFVILSLVVALASQSFVVPLVVAVVMGSLTLTLGGAPPRVYAGWFSPALLFALPPLAIMPFFFGSEGELFSLHIFSYELTATRDGLNLAVLVAGRLLGGVASLYFLAFTTPMLEIFSALERLRLPPVLLELAMLIYRYIFVVLEEAERMFFAMESRGRSQSLKSSAQAFALLAANLFARALARGERLNMALESRGYTGELKVLHKENELPPSALLSLIAFEILLVYLAFLTRGVRI